MMLNLILLSIIAGMSVVCFINRRERKRKERLLPHLIQVTVFYEVHNHMAYYIKDIRDAKEMNDACDAANALANVINDSIQEEIEKL